MAQQTEIRHAGAVTIADQNIGRLDVAMYQAAFVNLRHAREDLAHHHDGTRHRQRPVGGEYLCQRTPLNIFEHNVGRTAVHTRLKHWHDIRMTKFAGGLRSGHQQFGQQRIGRSAQRTGFNRHLTPEFGVVGEINHAFGAAAEHAYDAKTADVVVVTNGLWIRHFLPLAVIGLRFTRHGYARECANKNQTVGKKCSPTNYNGSPGGQSKQPSSRGGKSCTATTAATASGP